ncbi:MAG TPA: aldolase/citrate lyase family protein [Devosia sp.]|jgi:2-keto-3-deoxy-L-rhamnonate aldolase RhmA|nr:aldolase/citrate lyase family protein [Devosia sp.]
MAAPLNRTKQLIRKGELALGLIVRVVRSSEAVLIAKESGHDFIFLDMQHAPFDLQTLASISIAATAAGVTPMVRVNGYADPNIPVLLDAGVMGIIVPDVSTAAQAMQVVAACRYPPNGRRSYAGPVVGLQYQGVSPAEASRRLNDEVLVVCMIENREGLGNVDEIARVEGLDVLHIGSGDLAMDMGIPGQLDSPELAGAVRKVLAACKEAGIACGFGGDRNRERQNRYVAEGVRFVTTQADVALLIEAARKGVSELRPAE